MFVLRFWETTTRGGVEVVRWGIVDESTSTAVNGGTCERDVAPAVLQDAIVAALDGEHEVP